MEVCACRRMILGQHDSARRRVKSAHEEKKKARARISSGPASALHQVLALEPVVHANFALEDFVGELGCVCDVLVSRKL
jgi:hypothetical protein